ncbi:MAG: hypothetical protein D6762_08485 [Candidatus Neomarinimicrobiota bacterium]|nr:MAG: hypothetical protein D6762_08485 [Candidatus Neomarinimicrobiota bacterium]
MLELGNIGNAQSSTAFTDALAQTGMSKDDFFKLLIEQMKNQDPLEPMKNQEFAAQLAQFASLERLENINANLEKGTQIDLILTQAINNSAAATIIGKQVKAWGNEIHVKDGVSTYAINFNLQSDAAKVRVEILDENDNVIKTIEAHELGSGDQSLEWDGTDDNGNQVETGTYKVRVHATDGNDVDITARTYTMGIVEGIRYQDGSAVLIVDGEEVAFSDVREIGSSDSNG